MGVVKVSVDGGAVGDATGWEGGGGDEAIRRCEAGRRREGRRAYRGRKSGD